jgi:hypothetical protein
MFRLSLAAVAAVLLVSPVGLGQDKEARKALKKSLKSGEPMIGHMVYFKLKERTPAAREKLVAACDKYLSSHEGTVLYAAGPIAEDFKRDVNDTDWDVALHVVFVNKAAHDKYQNHPEHLKFIEENKETWDKVRVFDSALPGVKSRRVGAK